MKRLWPHKASEKPSTGQFHASEEVLLAQLFPDRLLGSARTERPETSQPLGLGAVGVAASFYGRAFALAKPETEGLAAQALTPQLLELIGRQLFRCGEIVFVIRTADGLRLGAAGSHTLQRAGSDPMGWRYRVTKNGQRACTGPVALSTSYTARIIPRTPWRGRSPVESGFLTGYLAATLEQRLGEEARGPVDQIIMAPTDAPPPGEESTMISLAQGLNMLRGKVVAQLRLSHLVCRYVLILIVAGYMPQCA